MNTNFESLPLLNNYLNSHIESLDQCEDKHAEVNHLIQVVRQNEGLLKGENTPPDALVKFLKSVTSLKEVEAAENEELTQVTSAAMSVFTHLGKDNIDSSLNAIHQLKDVGNEIYYQTLAGWIAEGNIKITSLHLSPDEMLKLAPYLTYLSIEGNEYTDEFIGEILANTKKLKLLGISSDHMEGHAFARFNNTEHLQFLFISNCPNFNKQLPQKLDSLKQLSIYNCPAFNQPFPDGMTELNMLVIKSCPSFLQMAPAGARDLMILPGETELLFTLLSSCKAEERKVVERFLAPFLKIPEILAPFTGWGGADALLEMIRKCGQFNDEGRNSFLTYLNETKNLPTALDFKHLLPGWIAEKKIPLNSLKLSVQEMLDLAPHLTYLSLNDAYFIKFTSDLIGSLLEKTEHLTELEIENCELSERVFDQLKNTKQLQVLSIKTRYNDKSNYLLPPDLSALQKLVIDSGHFNRPLPEGMVHLQTLEIRSGNFNQPLPADLSSLQTLHISCFLFDQPLPADLSALQTLIIESTSFNQPLPEGMEHLRTLMINGSKFKQPLPVFIPELHELSINCSHYQHPLPAWVGGLRVLKINCPELPLSIPRELHAMEELMILGSKGLTFDSTLKSLLEIYKSREEREWKVFVNVKDGEKDTRITHSDLNIYAHFINKNPADADTILAMIKKIDPSTLDKFLNREDIPLVKEAFLNNDPLQQLYLYNICKHIPSEKIPLLLGTLASIVKTPMDDFQKWCYEHLVTIDNLESFLTFLAKTTPHPQIHDKNSYHRLLIAWMTESEIPIKSLKLTEEEMIELAPELTYLDLTDGDLFKKNKTFTDQFVGALLEKTEHLKYLKIAHSNIDGTALDRFKNTEQLETLLIQDCDNFNHPLPVSLPNLHALHMHLSSYNQPLPERLDAIRDFTVDCWNFNQPLPEWVGGLVSLQITAKPFNHPLPSKMDNLQNLGISRCHDFNQPLPRVMPSLQRLTISSCENFNQPIPEGMDKLERMLCFDCPAFNIVTMMRFLFPIMQKDRVRALKLAEGLLPKNKGIDRETELGVYDYFIKQNPDQIDIIAEWVKKITPEVLDSVMDAVKNQISVVEGDPLQQIFIYGICAKLSQDKYPLLKQVVEPIMKTPMDPPLQKFYERILSLEYPKGFLAILATANPPASVLEDKTYYALLAAWIENEELPLKSLELSEEMMLELAPHLTYLDLTDKVSWADNYRFETKFLGELLEKTEKLVTLMINKSNIDEAALAKFKNIQHLQNFSIVNCPSLHRDHILHFFLPIYLEDRDRAVGLFNRSFAFQESDLLQLHFESQNPSQQEAIHEWISKITPAILGKAISRKDIPFVHEDLLIGDPLQQLFIYNICFGISSEKLPLVRQFLTPLIQRPIDAPLQKFYELMASIEISDDVLEKFMEIASSSHFDRDRLLKFFPFLIHGDAEKNLNNLDKTGQLDLFLDKFSNGKEALSIMATEDLFTENSEENAKTIKLITDLETEFNNLKNTVTVPQMPWAKEAANLAQTPAGKAFIKLHFHEIVKEPQLQEIILRAFPPSQPENLALYPMESQKIESLLEVHVVPTLPIADASRLLKTIVSNGDLGRIKIYYYGSPGADASGLGRQFFSEVIQGYIVNQKSLFIRTLGGEMYPYDPTHRLGPNANRESYKALGMFLGMALQWQYPTGKVLSEKALNCMLAFSQKDLIDDDFDMGALVAKIDPAAFIQFMKEATIEDEESVKLYEQVFLSDDSETVLKASRNLNDLLMDEEVDELIAGGAGNIEQIREHFRTIWVGDQAYSLSALHAIAQGMMLRLPEKIGDSDIIGWEDVRSMGAKELSKDLQGELTPQYVKEHIHVRIMGGETPEKRQTADNVRKWTDEWIDANGNYPEKLANFVQAFSGARAMTKDIHLDINPEYHTIEAHTCFNRADIPPDVKEGLLKLMWDDYATGNLDFTKA